MSNNFSISEWRRQQLHKEIITEDLTRISENEEEADMKKYRKEVLQQLLTWYKKQDELDQNMVKKLEGEIGNLNEGKITVKSIKFSDLSDKNLLPTNIGMGSSRKIKDEDDFKNWKADFLKKYGNIELEKGNVGWKASSEHEANKQAQADFDKNAKKNKK
jgi:hypothetical protein